MKKLDFFIRVFQPFWLSYFMKTFSLANNYLLERLIC